MAICDAPDCDRRLGPQNRSGYCEGCYEAHRRRRKSREIEGTRVVEVSLHPVNSGPTIASRVRLPKEPWA